MEIKDVENLANLARLELAEDEKKQILHDMQGILEYIKQIESVDVGSIDATYSLTNRWREDVLDNKNAFSHDLIVEQFPDSQDGFLKVKKIL